LLNAYLGHVSAEFISCTIEMRLNKSLYGWENSFMHINDIIHDVNSYTYEAHSLSVQLLL